MAMDRERFQQVEFVVEAALDRGEEAETVLSELCGDDEKLKASAIQLLASYRASKEFIETPVVGGWAPMPPPESLGPYRIERELGFGGMGTVYLAHRDDQEFDQQVAIKILRPGLSSELLERRFRSERQILAQLQHPNIGRLLEGGTTPQGLPYLVMEFVDGEPIDSYCDQQKLTIPERLLLFRKVCDAVAYAHRRLVVHRDLKPQNILVDEAGAPILLDFGIAKLLAPEEFGLAEEVTQTGYRPMSPAYASPEQVRGDELGTPSDIYSLGILLYEILTGHRPSRKREEPILAPSAAVMKSSETSDPQTTARCRNVEPEVLTRLLRGDLDQILFKALSPEPEERYASVDELSGDLLRHLEGLPVNARQGTFRYKAGKFVRRHRLGVGVAATNLLLLVGVATTISWQSLEIMRQRDEVLIERDNAFEIQKLIVEIFKEGSKGPEGELTAREALDRGGESVLNGEERPEIRISLLLHLAQIHRGLNSVDKVDKFAREALEISLELYDPNHLQVAVAKRLVASAASLKGDFESAAELLGEALEIFEASPEQSEDWAFDLGVLLNDLAIVERELGRFELAIQHYKQSLEIIRGFDPNRPDIAAKHDAVKGNLAVVYLTSGQYSLAEELFRDLLRNSSPSEPNTTQLHNLVVALRHQGKLDEALITENQVLAIWRKNHGEHPNVANGLNTLGQLHLAGGHYDKAKSAFEESLRILQTTFGPKHPLNANPLTGLGLTAHRSGDQEEAEGLLRSALALFETAYSTNHQRTAKASFHLGNLLQDLGRYEEAQEFYTKALEPFRKNDDPKNPKSSIDAASVLLGLGRLSCRQDDGEKARMQLERSLAITAGLIETNDSTQLKQTYALTLFHLGRYQQARPLIRELLQLGIRHPDLLSAFESLGGKQEG